MDKYFWFISESQHFSRTLHLFQHYQFPVGLVELKCCKILTTVISHLTTLFLRYVQPGIVISNFK